MSLRVIAPALLANVLILLVGISLLRKDEFLDEPPPVTIGTITGMVRYAASANDKWGGALPSTVTLSSRGRMANVLVQVSKGLEGQAWHAPSQAVSVRLDPRPSTSPPRIITIRAGQTLAIQGDSGPLNTVVRSSVNGSFSVFLPATRFIYERRFDRPEIGIRISYNIYGSVSDYLHVLAHPYYAVTDAEGHFMISDLDPGEYELTFWHPSQVLTPERQTVKVRIGQNAVAPIVLTYRRG